MEKRWCTSAQCAHRLRIRELLEEAGDLGRQQQALVDDGPGGKRRDIEEILVVQIRGGDFGFHPLADDEELALECVLVHARRVLDENLLDVRLRSARDPADGVGVDGRVPPAEDAQTFLADDALEDAFADQPLVLFDRQKTMPTPYSPGFGRVKPIEAHSRAKNSCGI